jgi:CheY-like chemotaxis protein
MTRTLLLADDSDVIQGLIERGLAELDFELIASDNGDEAIEMARSVRPDIVLADVGLPGRDGYQVCRAIKENPELSGVPVVLLAGAFDPFDPTKAQASGADDHITKPFEANALIQRLDALLAPGPAPEAPHPSLVSALAHAEESETFAEMPQTPQTPDDFVVADELDLVDEDDLIEALPLAEGHLESEGNSIGANGGEPLAAFDDAFDFGSPSPEAAPGESESGYLSAKGAQSFPVEPESQAQSPRFEHPAPVSDPDPLPDHLGEILSPLQGTHEQIAKEAFAQLPEAVIQLLVERVEAIAWEVIPGMAESLIREEIRRMKAGDE